jgi:hypothetical protein
MMSFKTSAERGDERLMGSRAEQHEADKVQLGQVG